MVQLFPRWVRRAPEQKYEKTKQIPCPSLSVCVLCRKMCSVLQRRGKHTFIQHNAAAQIGKSTFLQSGIHNSSLFDEYQ